MALTIQKFILRNIKYIPYFFKKELIYSSQHDNYALVGKLSASILHDILTPINSLSLAHEFHATKQSSLAPIIKESTIQIKEYVEIMKRFLSQEQSNVSIHLNSEILNCIKLLTYKAREHGVSIQFIELDQIYSRINPMHVYQIVVNLVSNAIEASAQGDNKKVILILKIDRGSFVLECKDFGHGICPTQINRICDPYFTTKQSGSGLGLYSVKYILSRYLNGTLFIQSEPRSGSLFSCTIPLFK